MVGHLTIESKSDGNTYDANSRYARGINAIYVESGDAKSYFYLKIIYVWYTTGPVKEIFLVSKKFSRKWNIVDDRLLFRHL
ncbi:hypothetical protein [Ligaoa zhengdingensis]|uniref:hypothetical protein n=1 Tax=Ligaoa zhengdingensis TaxID=2763658 RepID=UPI0031BB0B31